MTFCLETYHSISISLTNFLKFFKNDTKEKPSPSSHMGLWKYPTDRDKPFRVAEEWLESKRKDDDTQGLWRVYNKLYDLTSFISDHPGGSEWLEISRGTDITEIFETSHVTNTTKVKKILNDYYVRDCSPKNPRNSPFTLKPDGFYMTLKRRVEPIFQKVGTGPTSAVKLFQDSLVLTYLFFTIISVTRGSFLSALISGIFLALSTLCAHNFFHLKENWRKYYFDLSLSSSYEWRITHTFSHHVYPNTLLDFEISFVPGYEFLPNRPKSWHLKKLAVIYTPLLCFFGCWIDLGKRVLCIFTGKKKFRWEHLLPFIELFGLVVISGGNWKTCFLSWAVVRSVGSFVFLTIGGTAAHHHPDIFHDGDEPHPDTDFGIGQLDSTRDKAEGIFQNVFLALVTFGRHPLHHLFPTVCHSKLEYLKPVFEETLKEFKLDYPGMSQKDFYLGYYQQLARTEIRKRNL